jgi:hypothetical protein
VFFVIVSASYRTDIPAFYAPWLRHRRAAVADRDRAVANYRSPDPEVATLRA